MAKAVKSAFKWVGKAVGEVVGFVAKPIVRALTPKVPEVDTSSVVNFRADPNAGIPYVIGRTGTAGVYTYATVGEPKNRNILFYTILSGGGPITAFESFTMGGVAINFDGPDTPNSGPYRHLVWQRRQLGNETTYLPPPNTTDTNVLAEWDSTHRTSGYAAAWYVLGADQNAYSGGVPDPLWVLQGVRAYDWRQDSTYPGGSGPQRVNDPTTWAFNENPAVNAVTWILGRYQNGKRVLGLGATLSQIVMAKYTEWANICDANAWKVGGVVYSTDTKWQVLKAICQAGGAYPTPLGAKISVIFNAPKVSIATLTGADIEAEPSIVGTQSRRDRFNAAVPRYRSEANKWEIVPAQTLVVGAFVTADGGQRTKELEWPLVQNVDQATQLAAYGICNSRELGPIDFAVIPKWMGLEPGDCITVNEPEYGLTNQKMVIAGRSRALSSFERSISCVTETDSKHAFCLGQTGVAPPTPSLGAVDTLPPAPDPGEWTAVGGVLAGPDGALPAIVLTGSVTDPNAIAIIVEYREVISPGVYGDWVSNEYGVTTTRIEITGLKPGATYQVQVRYRWARNTEDPTVNLPLPPVGVGGVDAGTVGGFDPYPLIEDAQQAADDALEALFDPTNGALIQIEELKDQDAIFTDQIAVLDTDITTAVGRITTLEAKNTSLPNLIKNGDASASSTADPLSSWVELGGSGFATYGLSDVVGSFWHLPPNSGAVRYFVSDWYGLPSSAPVVVSISGDALGASGGARCEIYLDWGMGGASVGGSMHTPLSNANLSWTDLRAQAAGTSPASGSNQMRVVIMQPAGSPGLYFSRAMVNYGATALPYNDLLTERETRARVEDNRIAVADVDSALAAFETTATAAIDDLESEVSVQGVAIAGLQGRTATYSVKVAAAGADPAYFYMISDSTAPGGADSYIGMAAKDISLYNFSAGTLVRALSLTGGIAYFPNQVRVGPNQNLVLDGPNARILVRDDSANILVEVGQLL